MKRRRLLGAAAAAVASAGCVVGYSDGGISTQGGSTATGMELPVPLEEVETVLPPDHIPAIVDPAFAPDWSDLDPDGVDDPTLPDETAVVGVERDNATRAYPLRVLDWHEIVNDEFDGPIAVTYCVLCGSSVVIDRTVGGRPVTFGVSGRLWRDNLLLYDTATESLWSQLLSVAIRGPHTGERLDIVPSTLSSWGEWRRANPGTDVLLPPPHSGLIGGRGQEFSYFSLKYSYEDESQLIGYDSDDRLERRTVVIGVSQGSETRAYPFETVAKRDVVTDTVDGLPVVVSVTPDGTLVAYDRRIDGRERTASAAGDRHIELAGSRFERSTGIAVEGPQEGRRLDRANERPPMFWHGWSNFHPETAVYEG